MNAQENIIALLQGEMNDDSQLAELVKQLGVSSEYRRLLLEHIRLGQQVDRFVDNIIPTTQSTATLWSRIEAFESNVIATKEKRNHESNLDRSNRRFWSGVLFALLLGIGLGYWLGDYESGEVPTAVHHSYGSEKTSQAYQPMIKQEEYILADSTKAYTVDVITPRMLPKSPFFYDDSTSSIKESDYEVLEKYSRESLKVVVPNGGEHFKVGNIVPVIWSANLDRRLPTVLEYSADSGRSWLEIEEVREGRKKLWKIPNHVLPSMQCLARIVVEDTVGLSPLYTRTFLGHDSGAAVAEISPDGTLLATVGSDTKVLLWDLKTGQLLHDMVGHTSYVTFAKFSHDGTKFASCSQDGSVRIWNVQTGVQEHLLEGKGQDKKLVWAVAFSPDDQTVVTTNDDGTISFWDLESGAEIYLNGVQGMFKPHEESVRYIEYTADGQYIIASSTDKTASIIDAGTGQVLHRFVHHVDDSLGNTATRQEIVEAMRKRTVNGIQITPDGNTVVTCGYNGLVKFWDVETGNLIRSGNYHNGQKVSSVVLSPDGKMLASIGYDGSTCLVDVNSGKILSRITAPLDKEKPAMLRASFSRDMRLLAIAHNDGRATLWRLKPIIYSDVSDSFWSIGPCEEADPKLD